MPTSCSEVWRFTGLANYYSRLVEGYAQLAAQLTTTRLPDSGRAGELRRYEAGPLLHELILFPTKIHFFPYNRFSTHFFSMKMAKI